MNLSDYIRKRGVRHCAAIWNVKERTVISWMYRTRTPRKEVAAVIVKTSPVTYQGIYG